MDIEMLVKEIVAKMQSLTNADDAFHMKRYMKEQFEFFGVKSPARKGVQKEVRPYIKALSNEDLFKFVGLLWGRPQRELQYMAVDALAQRSKKLSESHLPDVESLILSKSWWDTVDGLAPNVAGTIFSNYPAIKIKWIEKWNNSDNKWLNRSALIHQLRYKDAVDLELLFALVESHIGSREFFINKASGWALRQASKFYPVEVKDFIYSHPDLSNLTKKEGSKYLST